MLPCVILAGGLGTRMRPLTDSLPKALVPVLGRPFAELQLEWLAGQGVRDVLFSIGYRGEMLRQVIGDGGRFGVHVTYVDEGTDLRGSGGALRLALDEGALPDEFMVLYGDSYLSLDLAAVEQAWRASGLPALMTLVRNRGRWDRSNAVLRGTIVYYDKRPDHSVPGMEWIDYGLSMTRAAVVEAWLPRGGRGDLAELFHELSVTGRVAAYEAGERFYEVGSPQGRAELEAHLSSTARSGDG